MFEDWCGMNVSSWNLSEFRPLPCGILVRTVEWVNIHLCLAIHEHLLLSMALFHVNVKACHLVGEVLALELAALCWRLLFLLNFWPWVVLQIHLDLIFLVDVDSRLLYGCSCSVGAGYFELF